MKLLDDLLKWIPFVQGYPDWVKAIVAGWILLSAVLLISILLAKPINKIEPAPVPGPTVDYFNKIQTKISSEQTESRKMQDYREMFQHLDLHNGLTKNDFSGSTLAKKLYNVVHIRLVIQGTVQDFRNRSDLRAKLGEISTKFKNIQDEITPIFIGLDINSHIIQYKFDETNFINQLPSLKVLSEVQKETAIKRIQTLQQRIVTIAKAQNLIDP